MITRSNLRHIMTLGYRIAYRLGLTPWEQAGQGGTRQLARLLDREEHDRTMPLGQALDLGCGTGSHTIDLARRGWDATGVDAVEHALATARRRPRTERARFVLGDVTDLGAADLKGDVDFFLDIGCFHGLTDDQRAAQARGVSDLATPTATLLMLAFGPGRRPLLPRGADQAGIEHAFTDWQVVAAEPADTSGMPGPLKKTAPHWFRLRRVR
jgi:SAM-dependent methyltransferase